MPTHPLFSSRTKALVSIVALTVVATLSADLAEAQNREAQPGQRYREVLPQPKNGGVGCGAATDADGSIVGGMFDYTDNGDSCDGQQVVTDYNNVAQGGRCNTVDYLGPELIYQFTVGDGNDITIVLTPLNPADLGIFLVSDCPNTLSCMGFYDAIGGGEVSTIARPGLPAGTYFVYVDSYFESGSASCGNYNIRITGDAGGDSTAGSGAVPNGSEVAGAPLMVGKVGDGLGLEWGGSCSSFDTDFAIYEGVLGDFTSHLAVACSTAGATSTVIAPSGASHYYLIVPHGPENEGSYGMRTGGQRLASLAACKPQLMAPTCVP